MEDDDHGSLWKRARHEISGVIADGAYATLLAIPVAIGVAAYAFVYLSFLRRRLHRRTHHSAEDDGRAANGANDE